MSLVLTVDTVFNNPDAPFLTYVDPIESKTGSLFLWDASLSQATPWTTSAGELVNSLSIYSDNIVGSPTSMLKQIINTNNNVKTEITGKGGVHFISGQIASVSDRVFIQSNTALTNYLNSELVKASPSIYISFWRKFTRKALVNSPITTYLISTGDFTLHEQTSVAITVKSGDAERVPSIALNSDTSVGTNYLSVFNPTSRGTTANRPLIAGVGGLEPFPANTGRPSYILYRVYIEDLSKSGRTYEQVKAIDDAEFAKAFGVGGKFYGDTWSNPATLLP